MKCTKGCVPSLKGVKYLAISALKFEGLANLSCRDCKAAFADASWMGALAAFKGWQVRDQCPNGVQSLKA